MAADPEADDAQVRLWQLISPALPVGAYAYSQGLEYAVHSGRVADEAGAGAWIRGHLHAGPACADVPVLGRCHAAWCSGDERAVRRWSRRLLANRGAAELLAEDRQLGGALARVLATLGVAPAGAWIGAPEASFAALFALAAAHWGIDAGTAARGYLWAWLENQVAAAVKLIPLGQSAGQRLLFALGREIGSAARAGLRLRDEEIGANAPGVAHAAARHERQYSRLFRS